jgi:hypothetical protein
MAGSRSGEKDIWRKRFFVPKAKGSVAWVNATRCWYQPFRPREHLDIRLSRIVKIWHRDTR